jgi:hypothetical protein
MGGKLLHTDKSKNFIFLSLFRLITFFANFFCNFFHLQYLCQPQLFYIYAWIICGTLTDFLILLQ